MHISDTYFRVEILFHQLQLQIGERENKCDLKQYFDEIAGVELLFLENRNTKECCKDIPNLAAKK